MTIVTQGDVPAGEDEDDPERLRHHLRGRRKSDQRNPHLRWQPQQRRSQSESWPAGAGRSNESEAFRRGLLAFSGVIHLPSCCSAPLADLMSSPT